MTLRFGIRLTSLLAVLVLLAPAVAAQEATKYPGLDESARTRSAADPSAAIVRGPAPAPAQQPTDSGPDAPAPRDIRRLTIEVRVGVDESNPLPLALAEAVEMALARNRDIEVARLEARQAGYDHEAARGVFDPILRTNSLFESRTTPVASALGGASDGKLETDTASGEATVRQLLPTGGFFEAGVSTVRSETNNLFASINPQWQSGLVLTYRQPLLRGFRSDDNRRRLRIAQRRLDVTDAQFRQRVIETIGAVQRGYWDLELALRSVQIARESVELAETQVGRLRRMIDQGLSAPVDLVQVETELERRREGVLISLESVTRAENTLKSLLLADRHQSEWDRPIIPTDRAEIVPVTLTLDEAVAQAIASRPELAALRAQREINDVDVEFFKSQAKPQLDVFASYGLTGLAGSETTGTNPFGGNAALVGRVNEISEQLGLDPLPVQPPAAVPPAMIGGTVQSFQNLFSNDFRTLRAGVELSLPVGNRTAEANLGRAEAEGRKIDVQRQSLEQRVEREVRNALQAVQTARQRVGTAQAAREAAEVQLRSEQRRHEAGLSTTFFVLTRQNELSDARARELRARADYSLAVVELQRVVGTTLAANAVDVETVRGEDASGE